MQALLRSIAPIIAAEKELDGKAISEGWANVSEQKLGEWLKVGQESTQSEVKQLWDDTYDEEYSRQFRRVSIDHLLLCHPSLMPGSAFGAAKES